MERVREAATQILAEDRLGPARTRLVEPQHCLEQDARDGRDREVVVRGGGEGGALGNKTWLRNKPLLAALRDSPSPPRRAAWAPALGTVPAPVRSSAVGLGTAWR